MMFGKAPKFSKGDVVVDSHGDLAIVTYVIEDPRPGKSHKVMVEEIGWDGHPTGPYYEDIFTKVSYNNKIAA